jgi:hypothetical protein
MTRVCSLGAEGYRERGWLRESNSPRKALQKKFGFVPDRVVPLAKELPGTRS